MSKLTNYIICNLKFFGRKTKLYMLSFYSKMHFLINKNFTLIQMYKPIIEEKIDTNKKLEETLTILIHKNKEAQDNILKLKKDNILLQSKISRIHDLITKKHH